MKPITHWFRDTSQDLGLRLIAALGLLLYLVFIVVPVLMSLRSSFTDENPLKSGSRWIGFANYSEMLHDSQLRDSVVYTLALALGVTVVANVIGLAFAMLLDRTQLTYRVLRTIAAEGTTILVVDQDVSQIMDLAQRVYCFRKGAVSLEGRPADLTRARLAAAYFGV